MTMFRILDAGARHPAESCELAVITAHLSPLAWARGRAVGFCDALVT